ncbi:PSP1 domain-containing protein [Bacillus subtilis]|uniref:PSP1 domain-containing protein n=1 Tax=Bacillus subtilis TaxID=1423 RepID=UPI00240DDF98|nr:stage 0 sporulation family protein [Bacillus subtilis]WFA92242.1 stage 0 sporulation family protein [Bacillus subtilis]
MYNVIGVRFKKAGKIYYFDPNGFHIEHDSCVIVETVRGVEYGQVVIANKQEALSAFDICQKKVIEHGLDMKLVDVEFTFDRNKVIFYFTADGRVDFRELVKDLASIFKTRIELRQIGVRDEAKMLGGIGPCGRMLCCSTFLGDFEPVSIKMAKDQNLSLNPTKISGLCGRLMCCLKYENDEYETAKEQLPDIGEMITTANGPAKVVGLNILERVLQVELINREKVIEYTWEELLEEGVVSAQTTD